MVLPTTSLFDWCQWLQNTPLATNINESIWLFPLIEGSHILALPISVGMIVMFDLRLLGLATGSKVTNEFLRWSRFGFAVMLITGVFLFVTQAGKAYNRRRTSPPRASCRPNPTATSSDRRSTDKLRH